MTYATNAASEGRLHIPLVDNVLCVTGAIFAVLGIIGILAA